MGIAGLLHGDVAMQCGIDNGIAHASGPLSASLRQRWETECAGMTPEALAFGMVALRDAMPELNAIRAQVVAEGVK